MKNIIIFDINQEFIEEATRLEKYGIRIIKSDVKKLINDVKVDALVSPANSFGFMDGGIDKVYMDIFLGIQNKVQSLIRNIGLSTKLDRYYLPIGSAITVHTDNKMCPYLVSAPTMFFPGNIKETDNIFFCFMAIIYLAKNNNNLIFACPGLGTGVGMLPPKYAIDQIESAILSYDLLSKKDSYLSIIKFKDKSNLILKSTPCKQIDNYANLEIPYI